MRLTVVNEQDELVGYKERDERVEGDIIRISALWLLNERNEVLIAQRAFDKEHDPGKWSVSAAGTVEEGETYLSNILKEAEEELGVMIAEKDIVPSVRRKVETSHAYFCQLYIAHISSDTVLRLQADEVVSAQWVSVAKLKEWFSRAPSEFVASFGLYLGYVEEYVQGSNPAP